MMLLKPELAILDETDSGLDVDAVRLVSAGIEEYRKTMIKVSWLLRIVREF